MQIGLGILGWTPTEFWQSTTYELYAAIEGWEESQGVEKEDDDDPDKMTKEKMRDLMRKFPD